MHIIKLNAIDSTNSYLRQLSASQTLEDYTVVVASHQSEGRGQMGTQWQSQEGKNLTVSVFKDVSFVELEHHFFISIVTSLSIFDALQSLNINKLKVKWPNDILSEDKKIAGILIENVIKQNKLQASIIGFGLNINQTSFENLPQATSIYNITGRLFNHDEILHLILKNLEHYFALLEQKKYDDLINSYENHLFRKNKPSTFKNIEGLKFSGYIKGITQSGQLIIQLEDYILKEFDFKEVTLLY
ncbi:biotin--[acetyl-CoA-carboxylase] ligase [Flavobacteriales bacterium 34_180_T64]|nr:biotin--[acetyl-CoA-carboxylase] ligase [Flavobacteriales bacterium 34_180_T64]